MKRKKVVVAMSGGVDSSVAAALLKKRGYDVIGVTMNLFSLPSEFCRSEEIRSCCGWKAWEDAQAVASCLRIPFYIADFRKEFEKWVVGDFCQEYGLGRTPNPCIRCNRYIKFDGLLKRVKKLGANAVATGHHARIEFDADTGKYLLKKGRDSEKDQSYFLFSLGQEELASALMPIGEMTKKGVREAAREFGLPVAQKRESQEVCFIHGKNYPRFLRERGSLTFSPGPIIDSSGRALGRHNGLINYTVGQRKGLGIAAAAPLYVLSLDRAKNTVIVGKNEELYRRRLLASSLHFVSGEMPAGEIQVKAKIRYRHTEAPARLTPQAGQEALVEFEKPQRAITPGQAIVFYEEDAVLGGGTIRESLD